MSVYTTVERDELDAFLLHYEAGSLTSLEGISDGIENSNYFVTTDQEQMVLTLFETHGLEEMGYFLELMAHLAEHGIPGADPVMDNTQQYLRILNNRPAALVQRLDGGHLIGECKLASPDDDRIAHTDIKLLPEFWGNGYGRELCCFSRHNLTDCRWSRRFRRSHSYY